VSVSDGQPRPNTQQRLALDQPWPHDRANFIVSACNAEALGVIEAWPAWPDGKLALIGPEGSGKTHLASLWARRVGAVIAHARTLTEAAIPPGRPILLEDVDAEVADETLFHVISRTDPEASLLLTARTAPRAWRADLPDLRSRLNALMVSELQSPDDVVLGGLLDRFFRERNIVAPKSVLDYLLRRIERSAPAALAVVRRIDEAAAAERRNITRELVREVLGEEE
jgi:chromosomal replication initiation ATPase DnaA